MLSDFMASVKMIQFKEEYNWLKWFGAKTNFENRTSWNDWLNAQQPKVGKKLYSCRIYLFRFESQQIRFNNFIQNEIDFHFQVLKKLKHKSECCASVVNYLAFLKNFSNTF